MNTMNRQCLVCVLMSVYKESVATVSMAIESIRQQTHKNLQIIVMLDYPEHEEMKDYLMQLGNKEPRLQYYINDTNMGLLFSLNKGMQHCGGELICRMDEDDYAEKDRIEKQINYMQTHNLDLVGCYTNLMDMQGNLLGIVRKYPSQPQYVERLLGLMSAIPHPTWLAKREVFQKLGGYRDIDCADDYDFLIRACLNGYRLGVVPEPLLRYRINQKGMTQQNIASQKVVSQYLANQMKTRHIYTVEEIKTYRKNHIKEQQKLVTYYTVGKRWKMGEPLSFAEKMQFLCNRYNWVEAKQRILYKWILRMDRKKRKR